VEPKTNFSILILIIVIHAMISIFIMLALKVVSNALKETKDTYLTKIHAPHAKKPTNILSMEIIHAQIALTRMNFSLCQIIGAKNVLKETRFTTPIKINVLCVVP